MSVGLVGSGPATEAVEAALGDVDRRVERVGVADLSAHELGVVVDQAGSGTFGRANELTRESATTWIAVELGGVGGYPVADAAVSGIDPTGGCYDCLSARVGSNVDPDAEPQGPPDDPTVRFAGAVAGRLATRFFDPGAESIHRAVVELPHADRTFLPVPGCACGEGRDRALGRDHVDRSLEETLARAEMGVDGRVGIVSEVGEVDSHPAPYYLAHLCDTGEFADATAGRQAAGVDPGWNAAFMKALGEAFERYCAGVYRDAEFRTGTPAAVENPVAPSAFVGPDPGTAAAPDGREAVDAADRRWVPGEDLHTGESVMLPAELVHYPPPERSIKPAITTGLGLGNSTVEALLSGLYEVIERDAATLGWYSTYDPLELVVEDEDYETLAARTGTEGVEVTALLLTQDVDVPVVCVVAEHDEWPRLAAATAAHLDPATAARDALAEAVQNWVELRRMGPEDAASAGGAIGRYATDPGPAAAFADADQRIPADSVGPEAVPSGEQHLTAVLDRLSDAGLDAYAARTTTRDVDSLGFETVRALLPAAQPLFFGDPFFGRRAETVPDDLGYEPRLDRVHHPFP